MPFSSPPPPNAYRRWRASLQTPLEHALQIVTAARRIAPPGSVFPHHHVSNPIPVVLVPPSSTIDLSPLSPHLQDLPLPHITLSTDLDLPRDFTASIALVAVDILTPLPSTTALSLPSLIDQVNDEAHHHHHNAASRLVLQPTYPTELLHLPLSSGPHPTTMEHHRRHLTSSDQSQRRCRQDTTSGCYIARDERQSG